MFSLAIVLGLAFFAAACRKKVDLVNGVPPVSRDFASMGQYMTQLAALPADQRAARLAHDYPHLQDQLVQSLRSRGKVTNGQEVRSVQFVFGSQGRAKAESGDGKTYDGFFKDQLVARVTIAGQDKPLDVLVVCLNGTFSLPGDLAKAGFTDLGVRTVAQRFTIGKGEGLIPHVGYQLAIDLAERFNLPLYRGKGWNGTNRISPAQARSMEGNTDREQVTVGVWEGDRFDLTTFPPTFTPSLLRQAKNRLTIRKLFPRVEEQAGFTTAVKPQPRSKSKSRANRLRATSH